MAVRIGGKKMYLWRAAASTTNRWSRPARRAPPSRNPQSGRSLQSAAPWSLNARRRMSLHAQASGSQFGGVQGLAPGPLLDLLAATEAVGQNQRLGVRCAHARQQHTLTCRDGDIVHLRGEADRARHAAASRGQDLVIEAELVERRRPQSGLMTTCWALSIM